MIKMRLLPLLALALFLTPFPAVSRAADKYDALARAALALAPANGKTCNCAEGGPCTCAQCDCCGNAKSYDVAYREALAACAPLLIMVGQKDAYEAPAGCKAVSLDSYNNDPSPRVLLATPGNGTFYLQKTWRGQMDPTQVTACAEEWTMSPPRVITPLIPVGSPRFFQAWGGSPGGGGCSSAGGCAGGR
jgi:hypothetical protein